jgi:hypothetical protein
VHVHSAAELEAAWHAWRRLGCAHEESQADGGQACACLGDNCTSQCQGNGGSPSVPSGPRNRFGNRQRGRAATTPVATCVPHASGARSARLHDDETVWQHAASRRGRTAGRQQVISVRCTAVQQRSSASCRCGAPWQHQSDAPHALRTGTLCIALRCQAGSAAQQFRAHAPSITATTADLSAAQCDSSPRGGASHRR